MMFSGRLIRKCISRMDGHTANACFAFGTCIATSRAAPHTGNALPHRAQRRILEMHCRIAPVRRCPPRHSREVQPHVSAHVVEVNAREGAVVSGAD